MGVLIDWIKLLEFFESLAAPVRFNRKLAAALEEHDQRVVSK